MSEQAFQKYMCVICGYIYDEEVGEPEHGLPAGTRWDDVAVTWVCPECDATKMDFEMVELQTLALII